MEKRTKQNLIVTVAGVCLFAALMNFPAIIGFGGKIVRLILPIIVGGILALFINVPMSGIEKRIGSFARKRNKKLSDKSCRMISFLLTLFCVLLVLTFVLTLVVPEIARSVQSLYLLMEARIPEWLACLDSNHVDAQWLKGLLAEIDIDVEQMTQGISDGIDMVLEETFQTLRSAVSTVVTAAFGLIIAVYMISGKERLRRHSCRLAYAYLKPELAERTIGFCRAFGRSFANFLSGQCGEAVILGMLMFIAFLVFRLPYASLVGVLTAVCAIIPYVGAFISCGVSVFLTLLASPAMAVKCVIVYVVVQFIENQFIYPRVVGKSVGLPPLYTLVAAMIGGKLFGIMGILFFIPLAAVVIEFVKEDAGKRIKKKVSVKAYDVKEFVERRRRRAAEKRRMNQGKEVSL